MQVYMTARQQRVDVLGFADHYYYDDEHSTRAPEWALQFDKIDLYMQKIAELRSFGDIQVRLGMEFDWLDDSASNLAPMAKHPKLDFTIGSVHYIGKDAFDMSKKYWEEKSEDERNTLIKRYWHAVRDMANSHLFDIAGHIDLVKKFGYYATEDVTQDIREALDAVKAADMVVELNTSGWVKDCKEAYPSEEILRACFAREIPVMLASDSHRARFVASNFMRGEEILLQIGYTQMATFRNRERTLYPIR